jgi:hypothetical protein
VAFPDVHDIDYVVMDRMAPHTEGASWVECKSPEMRRTQRAQDWTGVYCQFTVPNLVAFPDVHDIDYVVMDRMAPHVRPVDR